MCLVWTHSVGNRISSRKIPIAATFNVNYHLLTPGWHFHAALIRTELASVIRENFLNPRLRPSFKHGRWRSNRRESDVLMPPVSQRAVNLVQLRIFMLSIENSRLFRPWRSSCLRGRNTRWSKRVTAALLRGVGLDPRGSCSIWNNNEKLIHREHCRTMSFCQGDLCNLSWDDMPISDSVTFLRNDWNPLCAFRRWNGKTSLSHHIESAK